ncbi:L,D-transpeptidase [Pseudoxanthomonas koreensis]|uniref:L,D-transpeptidase n=1 Tax=Pseudoxanthomonas koreensis TaxID=266061 RepID=UPI001EE4A0E6|nr:L,D-transpeptidase [Pseudoxanthomonas koreensis]
MMAALLLVAGLALAQDAPRGPLGLEPGEFRWHPEIAPSGPVVLVVSLDQQRAYVYRNGIVIGVSTISSGKPGKDTPTGVFTILQKNKDHKSNLYNNAPMPYMQRLTWDGIALHGGALPGYPASHGCVRLPHPFAAKLFGITRNGDTVVVTDARAAPTNLVYPAVLAPVSASGAPLAIPEAGGPGYSWDDAPAPAGQVGIVVSLADQRVYVLRGGVPVGEAPLELGPGAADFHGTTLFVMGEGSSARASMLDPERPGHRWTAYPILDDPRPAADGSVAAGQVPLDLLEQPSLPVRLPEGFSQRLYAALVPGTTVLVTDLPALRPLDDEQEPQPVLESDG